MIAIPQELLDQVGRGNVLLFIGERVLRDADGHVFVDGLTGELISRTGLEAEEDHTLPEAAQAYEDDLGRQALVQLVRDRLDTLGDEPQAVHRLIASLTGCKVLATTCFDRRLERAFEESGQKLDVVVGNVDVAFEDERNPCLYKLRGSIERPESLVLTEDDYESFFDDESSISIVLQGYLARKTILFVGYDLTDPHFKRLLHKVTAPLDDFARRSYAFAPTSSPSVARWCKRHGIELVTINPETFLQALVQQVTGRTGHGDGPQPGPGDGPLPPAPPAPLPERPYKLLDYYDADDSDIFFGRDRETQILTSLIHAHRLVLLYGTTGTGKTSLLLAGTAPALERAAPPYATVYVRLRGSATPADAVRAAVRRRLRQASAATGAAGGQAGATPAPAAAAPGTTGPAAPPVAGTGGAPAQPADGHETETPAMTAAERIPEDGSLVEFMDAAARACGRTLVIFLDQFEEFFLQCGPQARQAFVAELGDLYDAHDLPVKLVLSLREDWLASINELRDRIPEVFNVDMRLLPLTRVQARQAITGPAEQLGMSYQPELVESLLDDLAGASQDAQSGLPVPAGQAVPAVQNSPDAGQPGVQGAPAASADVMPPQLQLVCDALYEQARSAGRVYVTLGDYQAVGKTQGVLSGYLEEALQKHPAEQRGVARGVLKALVSSRATRNVASVAAIVAATAASQATVEEVLERLVAQRLVRRMDDENSYELVHDVLAAAIRGWIGDADLRLKQVQELLRRELADWQLDPGVSLSASKLERVGAVRDSLRLTAEETDFLLRAAVLYGCDVEYWLVRAGGPAAKAQLLLEMLQHPEASARLNACQYLAQCALDETGVKLSEVALNDPAPEVRDAAALSIGRGQKAAGVAALVSAATEKDGQARDRAEYALALIEELSPGLLAPLTGVVRRRVDMRLTRIRVRHGWPAIRAYVVAGAFAGLLAFGLGLTVPLLLHLSAVYRGTTLLSNFFTFGTLLAGLGLLAGAGTALGISLGGAMAYDRAWLGRIAGGAAGGALSFVLALSPFTIGDAGGWRTIAGSALFGLMVAVGITVLGALGTGRWLPLPGGALGAALGVLVFGYLGFEPFRPPPLGDVPLPALLLSGALAGALLALGIAWAEGHHPTLRPDNTAPVPDASAELAPAGH